MIVAIIEIIILSNVIITYSSNNCNNVILRKIIT